MKPEEFALLNENDSRYKPHVYLDMDGVQCDFFKAWSKIEGVSDYKDIPKPEASIKRLASQGSEFVYRFFRDLEPLRGGLSVIKWLREHDIPYTILSAPLRYEHQASIMGKRDWLDKHHLGASESAIFASRKEKYATDSEGRPNVLIDDFGKNILPWRNKGGIGIKHDPDNGQPTIDALEQIYFGSNENDSHYKLDEASPDTIEGSFTEDLIRSKAWLTKHVLKIMQNQNIDHFNTIYVLGSWYGNMGLFLHNSPIKFDKLINVDVDKEAVEVGKRLSDKMGIDNIEHMVKDVNRLDYRQIKEPSLVINTSANDMEGTNYWLMEIPEGTLVAIQSREGPLELFDKRYPLSETLYLDKLDLEDPEEPYTRFMKIGVQ